LPEFGPIPIAALRNEKTITFAVVLCGRARGYALRQLDGLLKRRGVGLSAGYYLETASNYLPYNALKPEEIERLQEACGKALGEIIEKLGNRERRLAPENLLIHHAAYPVLMRRSKGFYNHFSTDENCSSCGACQKICPVDNIELQEGRPVWGSDCQFCLACIHYCPREAIQWKNVTQKKGRYHYKGISAGEIARQKQLHQ
jgi:ferredoxin